jgi:hypothetical protein
VPENDLETHFVPIGQHEVSLHVADEVDDMFKKAFDVFHINTACQSSSLKLLLESEANHTGDVYVPIATYKSIAARHLLSR